MPCRRVWLGTAERAEETLCPFRMSFRSRCWRRTLYGFEKPAYKPTVESRTYSNFAFAL